MPLEEFITRMVVYYDQFKIRAIEFETSSGQTLSKGTFT